MRNLRQRLETRTRGVSDGVKDNEHLLTSKEIHWGFRAKHKKYLIDPTSTPRQIWDFVIIILVFYVAITVPYELGFKPTISDGYKALSISIDALFGVDMILQFLTTFKHPETHFFVNDYKMVATRYLQ
eukprot:760062_1